MGVSILGLVRVCLMTREKRPKSTSVVRNQRAWAKLDDLLMSATKVERIFRDQRSRVLASVARAVNDLALAEDALQDAFVAALAVWPREGFPKSPAANPLAPASNWALN